MNKFVSMVCSFFGVATDASTRQAARLREVTHEEFKTAVRANNQTAIQDMLGTRRLGLNDELDRGRGLLQFAVMANSLKTVNLLVKAGLDGSTKDSLGASAVQLAKKSGTEAMMLAVGKKAAVA